MKETNSSNFCPLLILVLFTSDNLFLDNKIHFKSFSNPLYELSDVNKTFIDISNEHKFEVFYQVRNFEKCKVLTNTAFQAL